MFQKQRERVSWPYIPVPNMYGSQGEESRLITGTLPPCAVYPIRDQETNFRVYETRKIRGEGEIAAESEG